MENRKADLNNRNLNIDLARCLACLGVVGLHGIGMSDYTLYYFCSFSVPMFFMINGYLMFRKDRVDYTYSLKKALSYIRIIILWNIVLAIPLTVIKHKFVNPLTESVRNIFQKGYLWHFWYFGAMLLTLLLLPLVHTVLKKSIKIHIASTAVLFICSLLVTLSSMRAEYPNQAFVPQFLRVWVFGFYFLFGGLMGVRSLKDNEASGDKEASDDKETSDYKKGKAEIKVIILSVAFVLLTYIANTSQKHLGNFSYHNRIADNFYDEGTVMIWCAVFFMLLLSIKVVIPEKTITGFGKLSLGIFILHPLFLKATEILNLPDTTAMALVRWALAVTVCAIASFVMLKIPYIKKMIEL